MLLETAEFNTIITGVGMACATVQGTTGFYAVRWKKKPALIKTNDVVFRAHRAFGSFATCLYFLGLFAGTIGLVGALLYGTPPLELDSASFNIHTWGSFPAMGVILWKTWCSYFRKRPLYGKGRWLGPAAFLAWGFTWISAAVSFYVRTLPSNPQHPPPTFLLGYDSMGLQLALPFLVGGAIGLWIVRQAESLERSKAAKNPG